MKRYLSWSDIDYLVDRLQTDIRTKAAMEDKLPNEIYKGIYGIPRGGLIIAVMLSHRLNIPYKDRLQEMYGHKFLVVDDIADSGETLSKLKAEVFNGAETATLHYNELDSIVRPDFWVEEKGDNWIVYPWENNDSLEIQDYKL